MNPKRLLRKTFAAGLALVPTLAVAQAQQAAVRVVAGLPVEQAWVLLQDFSLPHNYVPNITRTEIVSQQLAGVGAHRRVYDKSGDYLEETIIEWREGEGFVIRLHDGDQPMTPFERSEFSYSISASGASKTVIELALTFEMPWGGFGETLGDWVILPVMEKQLVLVAAGMKHFYETGQAASDEDRERLADDVEIISPGE